MIEVGSVLSSSPDRARFVCLDGIHMTEPYHRLMAKEWLKFLVGARRSFTRALHWDCGRPARPATRTSTSDA